MKRQPALHWLVPLIGVLALIAAGVGLSWQPVAEGSPFSFTTLRGQTVEIYGQGVYRNDTVFSAAGFKGTDVVTLLVSLPFLAITYWLYRPTLGWQALVLSAREAELEAASALRLDLEDDPALVPLETLAGRNHHRFPAGEEPPWRWRIASR